MLAATLVAAPVVTRVGLPSARAQTASSLLAPDLLRSNGADLRWTRYAGAGFDAYAVHRSRTASFTPSPATLIAELGDRAVTRYRDTTASPGLSFTYKIVTAGTTSNGRTVTLPSAGRATLTLQPDAADGSAVYLNDFSSPLPGDLCKNYGASSGLRVGTSATNTFRPLLRFDLRRIPSDAVVESAELSLYYSATTADIGVDVHRVTRSWREGSGAGTCTGDGATWRETQAGVPWGGGVRGGQFVSSRITGTGTKDRTAAGWDTFSVTNTVARWTGATASDHGFLLERASETTNSPGIAAFVQDVYPDEYNDAPSDYAVAVSEHTRYLNLASGWSYELRTVLGTNVGLDSTRW
ncbi:MAG TPA: DNRLRE domain-containing protein [Actinomycetota bacterium]|nr:DNRLRE domain-containing protein [Actinomycetota bacterium]